MPILIIILDDSNYHINCHPMQFHPMLHTNSVTEATTKNVECLEAPMKRLLTVLAPGKELLKICWVFILLHNNFLWFSSLATICHALISLLKLKVESILVPVIDVQGCCCYCFGSVNC